MRVLWLLAVIRVLARAQVVWTPIHFQANDQIDMWTAKTEGCRCSYDLTKVDCACCVREGGCQCGLQSPNRCGQCGIHQYCNKMCNITLSSRTLLDKSGKRYGQIKSPSLEGPTFCWYRLLPDSGQRVEIQIYRLVNVGRFNGTGCDGGFVQLVSGLDSIPRPRDAQVCGHNERYAPPVVMFEDRGAATLIFQITERTERSQFLAYFSFTSRNSTHHQNALNFQPWGGRRIEGTDCDWMYQESWCRDSGSCRLATPGYPGIYGPNKRCKYHISTSTPHTRVRIKFLSLSLPSSDRCTTDFVKIYHGSSDSSPLVETLCGNKKKEVIHSGPNLYVLFSSGPLVSPFHYNGFVATLDFWERQTTTQPTVVKTTARTTVSVILAEDKPKSLNSSVVPPCELLYYSNQSRHGLFDSRGLLQENQRNCSLIFIGGATELVFISLANYILRSSGCQSRVELYDGYSNSSTNLMKRICSPVSKRTRDNTGRFRDRENYISKSNVLQLNFKRYILTQTMENMEYVQGAFLFHDELLQGTPAPSSLCDVEYHSNTSNSQGQLTNPGETEIYWTVDGSLECTQKLEPNVNQSISLNIVSLRRLSADTHCHTECGDGGCKCVTNLLPLDHMDHLQILNYLDQPLCCICGPFQEEWLPVGVRSWSPLRLRYYVARYNWATKGFEYETDYMFHDDHVCGHHVMTQHSGVIDSVNMTARKQLNFFLYQSCTWKLDSNVERQLTLLMSSTQKRPCSAWNLSIHEYYELGFEHAGRMLHTFCSKDGNKTYTLPFKLNIVIVRLRAMTNKPPQFIIKWRSQVVRSNTRISGYIPMVTSSEPHPKLWNDGVTMATTLLSLAFFSLVFS